MTTSEGNETAYGARRNSVAGSHPLIEAATPGVFRANAFRITGLAVDATTREITKHADKLKILGELGHGDGAHGHAFALSPVPSVDQIREAIQKLRDPEKRIVDEFFWFWPDRFGHSPTDPAIQAIIGGDRETALKIWTAKETSPDGGVIAMHNIAVLWHLVALEWEDYIDQGEIDDSRKRKVERYWRDAFKRWAFLATDDVFWETISLRVGQLNDARLTTGFVRRMRSTFPQALDKINGELAIRHAERGRIELARLHVQFMREAQQGSDNVERTAELVLAPATTRLRQQIQRAAQRGEKDAADAVNAARELLDHARQTLHLFDLFFDKDSTVRNDLSDEVASLCNQLPITYHKATGDDKACIEILRSTLPFATSSDLRRQIEKNIGTLTGNVAFTQLEPVFKVLKAIQESKEAPSARLVRFNNQVALALAKPPEGVAVGSEAHVYLCDFAAAVLRGIALTAWNDQKDLTTAVAANELARKHAKGSEIKQRLTEDQTSLSQMAAQRAAHKASQQQSSKDTGIGCLAMIGIVGLVALIGSLSSNNGKTASNSYSSSGSVSTGKVTSGDTGNSPYTPSDTSAVHPSYTAPSSDSTAPGIYRVPHAKSAELDSDRQAVERAKAQAASFSAQVDLLAQEIERDRRFLDNSSQSEVDAFNRKVNRYNAMIELAREQDRQVNRLVDDYNRKLRLYGH